MIQGSVQIVGKAVGTVGTVASSAACVMKDGKEVTKEASHSRDEAIKEKSGHTSGVLEVC